MQSQSNQLLKEMNMYDYNVLKHLCNAKNPTSESVIKTNNIKTQLIIAEALSKSDDFNIQSIFYVKFENNEKDLKDVEQILKIRSECAPLIN